MSETDKVADSSQGGTNNDISGFNSRTWAYLAVGMLAILVAWYFIAFQHDEASDDIDVAINSSISDLEAPSALYLSEKDAEASSDEEDDDAIPISLSAADARILVQGAAVLDALTDNGSHELIANDPVLKELLERAQAVAPIDARSTKGTALEGLLVANLPDAERQIIIRQVELTLHRIAGDYVIAAADQAVEKIIHAEAELYGITKSLKAAVPDATLPDDPLGLLPAECLKSVAASFRAHKRLLEYRNSVAGTPVSRSMVEFVDRIVSRLAQVAQSNEHRNFRENCSETFDSISISKWQQAAANSANVVAAEEVRLRGIAESETGYKELSRKAYRIRGPPLGLVDRMLLTSVDEFVLNPRQWICNEAQLLSLGDELASVSEIPLELREKPDGARDRIMVLAENVTLTAARDAAIEKIHRLQGMPDSSLFPEQHLHLQDLADRCKRELTRRESGGSRITVQAEGGLADIVARHPFGAPLTRRAEAHLLGLAGASFQRWEIVPLGVRDDVLRIHEKSLKEYTARINVATKEYERIGGMMALTTEAVSPELIAKQQQIKQQMKAVLQEYEPLVADAAKLGIDAQAAEKQLMVLKSLFSRGPPDVPPTGAASTVPTTPKSPSPTTIALAGPSQGVAKLANVRSRPKLDINIFILEGCLGDADRSLKAAAPVIEGLNRDPVKFGTAEGRRTLKSAAVASAKAEVDWVGLEPKKSTRLPASIHDWRGRFKQTGNGTAPYDYRKEVKNARSLAAVGGGIHLGEVAIVKSAIPLAQLCLRYSPKDGLHFYDGATGDVIVVDNRVAPTDLKALYRFANSRRNAAISIGWADATRSLDDLAMEATEGSPILLDPYLVDTRVGQDLILADCLPWNFDESTLPNGAEITFEEEFARELKAFNDMDRRRFRTAVQEISPYDSSEKKRWLEKLEVGDAEHFLPSLLQSDSIAEAGEYFSSRTLTSEQESVFKDAATKAFFQQLNDEGISASNLDEVRQSMRERLLELALTEHHASSIDELDDTAKQSIEEAVESRTNEFVALAEDDIQALVKQMKHRYFDAVAEEIIKGVATEAEGIDADDERSKSDLMLDRMLSTDVLQSFRQGECTRARFDLWIARMKGMANDHEELGDLARMLLGAATTLSYLYDDVVNVELRDNEARFTTELKYRYVTTYYRLEGESVGIGRKDDSEYDIEDIPGLTKIANSNIDEVIQKYLPLQRVQRYAELAALFRWAIEARENNELAAIDLSELAAYPANDPQQTPTADAILK